MHVCAECVQIFLNFTIMDNENKAKFMQWLWETQNGLVLGIHIDGIRKLCLRMYPYRSSSILSAALLLASFNFLVCRWPWISNKTNWTRERHQPLKLSSYRIWYWRNYESIRAGHYFILRPWLYKAYNFKRGFHLETSVQICAVKSMHDCPTSESPTLEILDPAILLDNHIQFRILPVLSIK